MTFSLGAFATCIMTSLLLVFLLDLMIRKKFYTSRTAGILTVCLSVTAVRMILPFNFPFTITLYSYTILPIITAPLYAHVFSTSVRIDQIIFTVWGIVTLCLLIRFVIDLVKLRYILDKFRTSENDACYSPVFRKVRSLYSHPFTVSAIPANISPAVTGLFCMHLIIPASDDPMISDDSKAAFILHHEISHFQLRHTWLNLLFSLAAVSQWWNPFMYLLKKDLRCLIELEADEYTVENQTHNDRLQYAESIVQYAKKIARADGKRRPDDPNEKILCFVTKKSSVLSVRIDYLLTGLVDQTATTGKKIFTVLLHTCMILLTAASVFLVPESSGYREELDAQSEQQQDSIIITEDNSRFKKVNDRYALYVDGYYYGTVTEIPEELSNIPVDE